MLFAAGVNRSSPKPTSRIGAASSGDRRSAIGDGKIGSSCLLGSLDLLFYSETVPCLTSPFAFPEAAGFFLAVMCKLHHPIGANITIAAPS